MVNIAVRAARAAGNIIVRNMDRIDRLNVATKPVSYTHLRAHET